MQIIEGNILDITSGIICHQVNCRGVFNAGLAKQFRQRYPEVYEAYMDWYKKNLWELGKTQIVQITDELSVANMAGQFDCGTHRRMTNYPALETCLKALQSTEKQIYLPYGLGSGLAGGDWRIIRSMIDKITPQTIVVKLPQIPALMS